MSTISKSVLQITGQVIHEDDDQDIIDMLYQARDNIKWEMETPQFSVDGTKCIYVLRYIPDKKMWATYRIFAHTRTPVFRPNEWNYRRTYDDALYIFEYKCEELGIDLSQVKRTRTRFGTR